MLYALSDPPSFIRLSEHNSNPSNNANGTFWIEEEQVHKIQVNDTNR